jgi:ribosomal protein S18 acetylase RimI-like enzyme
MSGLGSVAVGGDVSRAVSGTGCVSEPMLREFRDSDLGKLADMEAEYYREVDTAEEFCQERFYADIKKASTDPSQKVIIAQVGDDIAGFIVLEEYEEPDGRLGYISNIHVAKGYRGRGIGKHLLTIAEEHFKKKNIMRLQLEVVETNRSALGLYTKRGYKLTRYDSPKNEFTPPGDYLEKELT